MRTRFLTLLLSGVILAVSSTAQTGRGSLNGRAADAAGAVLQGARIELTPSGRTAVSDGQGEFNISDLEAGNYKVTVLYVGFTTFTKDIVVTGGQSARIDAVLQVSASSQEVTVFAERQHGEAEAINRELTSPNILQVLPVEVITSLPNTNIADALGRLPSVTLERDEGEGKYVQIRGLEPRLSNVTVNGINVPSPESGVRQIKLDVIPANLVDSVEINKTLSANQDGDAIGGSVNLVTKTAGEKPTFYINGNGGYTPIEGGRSLTEIDGTVGKRFGTNKKLGILVGGSYDWNGRGIDDVESAPAVVTCDPGPTGCMSANPSPTATNFVSYSNQDLREYQYYRSRYGFAGSVDYKLGDVSGLYARMIYSHFNNFGDRWDYGSQVNGTNDVNGNPLTTGYLTPTLSDGNGTISFGAQIRRPVEVIGSLEAGGKHAWAKWLLEYDFSISRSADEDHGYSSTNFAYANNLQFNIDRTNPLKPQLTPVGGFSAIHDLSQYFITSGGDVSKTYSPQLNLQTGVALEKNYEAGGHFGTFQFGAKIRNAHKFEDANDQVFMLGPSASSTDPALAASNFAGSFTNPSYYDKAYTFGPTVNYSKVTSFLSTHISNDPLDPNSLLVNDLVSTEQNTLPNNYDLVERVTAGFLMNTLNYGRVRLQTGLRFENTSENLLGVVFDLTQKPPASPKASNSSYLDVLPSAQVRFGLPHDAAIRVAYGRGIARPNFSDLPPTFNVDVSNQKVSIGNPNLKPTRAHNFDVLFEQSLHPLGLIQAGFFYKKLSQPIYSVGSTRTTDPYNGFQQTQPVNGSDGYLYGFEVSYQQRLSFLPGVLNGFGLSANYSYTASKTKNVPGRTDDPQFQRQAPNTWNISPTYDRGRFSSRLGISHNDANIFQYNYSDGALLGKQGPNGDVYLYSHTQVDAQGSFRMYRGLHLIVYGLNLTNEVFGFYQGSPQYPIQREFYKPSYAFGLRYSYGSESN